MIGLIMALQEQQRLRLLREEFITAEDLNKNHCVNCGFCCHKRSCIPTPDELVKIAEHLKLSPKECIEKYFCIDFNMEYGKVYYVKPTGINTKHKVGKLLSCRETYNEGKCIFLTDKNKCLIHDVKPQQAKDHKCWEDMNEKLVVAKTAVLINSWKGNVLKERFGIEFEEDDE
jgi:Fe-S-cluster containining protein